MDKRELATALTDFLNQPEYTVDLFFVYKTSDNQYVKYLVDQKPELRQEIINGFQQELQVLSNANNAFRLVNVFDDNEYGDYTIYTDELSRNNISNEIFNYNRETIVGFDDTETDITKVFGFIISLFNGIKTIKIFKKSMPTQAMKRTTFIGIFKTLDNTYTTIERDAVFFSRKIDIINIDNKVIIKNYNVYENNFGFKDILNRKASENFGKLCNDYAFFFTNEAIEKFSKLSLSMRKKLINCLSNNPILTRENYSGIRTQARKYLNHEFETTADNKIKIKTKKEIEHLITILNRDINYNAPAKEVYITRNKKLIKRYKPRQA